MWWRTPETIIFNTLEELNIGFVSFSPLGKGFLTGKFNSEKLSPTDFRSSIPRFSEEAMKTNRKFIDFVKELADSKGITSAQLALAWVLAQKPYIVPIPGTTKIQRLQENIKAAEVELTETEIKNINSAIEKIEVVGARYATAFDETTQK